MGVRGKMTASPRQNRRAPEELWRERPVSSGREHDRGGKPGRPLLPKDSIRDRAIRVRLTRPELARLESFAAEQGESVAIIAHGLLIQGLASSFVQPREPSETGAPTTLADVRRSLCVGGKHRPSRTTREQERARAQEMRERGRTERRRGRHEYSGIEVYGEDAITDAAFAYHRGHGFHSCRCRFMSRCSRSTGWP